MVIVDTSVWVQFLRVKGSVEHLELDRLLAEGDAVMVGGVLAEILQGARSQQEFDGLNERLSALPYLEATQETWVRVGALSYQLRQRGVMVALGDLLIAALALEHDHQVYTLDEHFQRVPGLRLYEVGAS
ncbi:MAG: PIN domain-containing protein [Chloroflexi bacterium]|nr:PIN domain-containing protein [Chloroflexota bacterium]